MKKIAKTLLSLLLICGILCTMSMTTSCKSENTMYRSKQQTSKTINKNYKVRGTNKKNGSTYRTY